VRDFLLEFLRTGMLGTIRLGMSSDELRDVLGEPNDVGYQRKDDLIWLFGSQTSGIQIPLANNRVTGIWVNLRGVHKIDSIPVILSPTNWQITGHTTIEEFTEIMNAENIKWKTYKPLTFDTQTCIVLQSDVHVVWAHDGAEGLEKIMLTEGINDWSRGAFNLADSQRETC
jgi:hypothetical protein